MLLEKLLLDVCRDDMDGVRDDDTDDENDGFRPCPIDELSF